MQVEWQDGLVKHLAWGSIEALDWGAETSDHYSFFSLTDQPQHCEIKRTRQPVGEGETGSSCVEVKMAEGQWTLEMDTRVGANSVDVTQTLTCLAPSTFQDFVMRFKFTRASFDQGEINGEIVPHDDTNKWYQHAVDRITLTGASGRVQIQLLDTATAGKFRPVMYIRDEPGSWIVHVRLLPQEPCDQYWIKWSNRLFTASINDHWSRILLGWPWLKRTLWYLSERRGGRPQLQAIGLSRLDAADELKLSARVQFD